MSERLTPEQLSRVESDCDVAKQYCARHGRLPTSTGLDVLDRVPSMVEEIRARRALDLTASEIEAVRLGIAMLRESVRGAIQSRDYVERSCAAMAKVLARGGGG
jgi:hypothetical protein